MEESYSETRFAVSEDVRWPAEFVILSAHATTGEHWTARENERADLALGKFLKARQKWLARVICVTPSASMHEPCWAFHMPFEAACELGLTYRQEALFLVRGDELFVSYCDERRALRPLGRFRTRLDRY